MFLPQSLLDRQRAQQVTDRMNCFSSSVNIGNRRSPKGTKIALTNAAMALASGGGGGGSMAASAVGGKSASAAPVYQLSCDNEVKIVKFRYNFLIHNIFERINGELEKLIKVRKSGPRLINLLEGKNRLFFARFSAKLKRAANLRNKCTACGCYPMAIIIN